ncbi:Integral membrane protein [Streptomyces venezuelae]|uniref:AI-2E family transporter n=1 Tax=Streptomyces gardneri TaxID=66892 RepID=UPI0006E3E25C|nr:AI-2E family transporter [Streptomyces gardneri]ALO12827.1 Integral membrane protein [Streptomyces venezuelae]QPK49537.1 AI-2E family transporter [Streptomyces gardneri]WRK41079.1 AI-2E family transporter [Streptomyces venezuelae]
MQPGTAPPVTPFLRTAAAYAWRLLIVGLLVYSLFAVLGRFHEIGVALFLGLVITALLRPVADVVAKGLPRPLAVALTLLGGIALVLGVLTLVGEAVAGERTTLVREFRDGVDRIEDWLVRPPFRLHPEALTDLQARIGQFLSSHRSALVSEAVSGAGHVVAVFTTLALAVFSAVFFIHAGDRQWDWFQGQLPSSVRGRVGIAGRAAWRTFTGYTHGIVLVAATNAVLVGLALWLLGVPLAVPLALLEFVAAFVPLIGSPVALAVAAVVALASQGPVVAAIVVALIVVMGQIEGHVLHPLVMSWAVRLHPLVVAISVIAGSIAAGIVGAVVAVPLVSVVWSVHTALREAREAAREGATEAL